MNIIMELYFEFGRWTKSERNQTVTSMNFNKTLKWVLDYSTSLVFGAGNKQDGLAKKKKKKSGFEKFQRLKYSYSLILFIILAMLQPLKLN